MESRYCMFMNMIIVFLIFAGVFTPCRAKEESVNHGSRTRDTNLILDIIKRLSNSDDSYLSDEPEQSTDYFYGKQPNSSPSDQHQTSCIPVIQQGNIIKATESTHAGAGYIDSIKGVKSNAECLEQCCYNSTCDVAVYQDKSDRYCYLFRCEGKCLFEPHSGYFVNTIKHRKPTEQSEEDLQNLNGELPVAAAAGGDHDAETKKDNSLAHMDKAASYPEEQTTAKPVVTLAPTEAQEPVIAPHSVGLSGFCTQDRQCEDPNAVCTNGNCACHETYYSKEGICRKVCPSSSFECFELGTLSRGPECVSQSQVCDSYMQCADGSDEYNCENIAPKSQPQKWSQQLGPAWSSTNISSKNNNAADSYTQPVVQETAGSKHQVPLSDAVHPQNAVHETRRGQMVPDHNTNIAPQEINNVRPSPTAIQSALSGMENSMNLKQDPIAQLARPNPITHTGFVENQATNKANTNPVLSQATNPNYDNPVRLPAHSQNFAGGYIEPEKLKAKQQFGDLSQPYVPSQQFDDLSQPNAPSHETNVNPSGPVTYGELGSRHQKAQGNKKPVLTNSEQLSRPSHNVQSRPAYSGDMYNHNPNQIVSKAINDGHNSKSYSGTSVHDQGESRARPVSNSENSDSDRIRLGQNGKHFDMPLLPQKVLLPPSPLSSSESLSKTAPSQYESSNNDLNRPKVTSSQSSSKTYGSSGGQFVPKSPDRQSQPSYSNSKWALYLPFGLEETPSSQQRQQQQPVGNPYYDSSQFYPPYASDTLDSLPESLSANTGTAEDFSQYGNPYLSREKSYGSSYQNSNQNAGYLGYPDSAYGNQYPASSRYDYSGEYRSPGFQDPEFYPSIGSQKSYRPSAGLYEDFPGGLINQKPVSLNKAQGKSLPPEVMEHKPNDYVDSVPGGISQGIKTSHSNQPRATVTPGSPLASNATTLPKKDQPKTTTSKTVSENHGAASKHVFMSSEKVIIASTTSNAEGPIIALSLGLAFTLILLVLLGCRMRNMRHRLRKGRPLHQNEADYLINGMYL